MMDICMVNPKDACIPVRMWFLVLLFILWRENHDVPMSGNSGIDGVLGLAHIVCRIVDTKDLVSVYRVLNNMYIAAVFW